MSFLMLLMVERTFLYVMINRWRTSMQLGEYCRFCDTPNASSILVIARSVNEVCIELIHLTD